jgi:hypothetical protein
MVDLRYHEHMKFCTFVDCRNRLVARGLCSAHYRQLRNGEVLRPIRYVRQPVADRFWPKVDRRGPDECWPWLAARDNHGYGQMTVDYKRKKAHRLAYELLMGPIPEGLSLDHLCRHPWCVNPAHLQPVCHAENVRRGAAGIKVLLRAQLQTHCKNGHEFTDENTYLPPSGRRVCRACQNQWQKDYQARRAQSPST